MWYFFFQAEDGIREAQESRGLGDVYKRQGLVSTKVRRKTLIISSTGQHEATAAPMMEPMLVLSLIHI